MRRVKAATSRIIVQLAGAHDRRRRRVPATAQNPHTRIEDGKDGVGIEFSHKNTRTEKVWSAGKSEEQNEIRQRHQSYRERGLAIERIVTTKDIPVSNPVSIVTRISLRIKTCVSRNPLSYLDNLDYPRLVSNGAKKKVIT